MCKVGLVLSGGMAKGAYQIGALKAINEYFSFDDIAYISSSSIGVLNAYAFTANKLKLIEDTWRDVCFEGTSKLITSVCKSAFLQYSIKNLADATDHISPYFYTTLYDLKTNTLSYSNLSEARVEDRTLYLKASVAMPFYSKALKIGENAFLDGAIIDNIPVYPLQNHPIDYLICIYFDECNYIFENENLNKKIIKLIFSDKSIIKNSIYMDKKSIDYMIENGYCQTKEILETIFSRGTEDLEYIYRKIALYNQFHANSKLRISGDMLISNCNRVAKKLLKRKIIK